MFKLKAKKHYTLEWKKRKYNSTHHFEIDQHTYKKEKCIYLDDIGLMLVSG